MIKVVAGTLFGLAVMAAIARTLIRYRTAPNYTLDDVLLLFACICLVASTVLLYELIPNAYIFEELEFGERVSFPFPITDLAKETLFTVRILDTYTLMSWLVIYAVKFCFLSFFRLLIDRVQRMIIYWRIVVMIIVVLGGLNLCETFIACPYIETSSSKLTDAAQAASLIEHIASCLQGSRFRRTLIVGIIAKLLDIITDILRS